MTSAPMKPDAAMVSADETHDETRPIEVLNSHALLIGGGRAFTRLLAPLAAQGIAVQMIASGSQREIVQRARQTHPDMVIVAGTKRAERLLRELGALPAPPLLIAIISASADDLDLTAADVTFTFDAPLLSENIVKLLALHRRARVLPIAPAAAPTSVEIDVLKTMIVKTVSHELRTPLLQVKSAVSLLAEGENDRERLIGYALESLARLEHVVGNITRLAESLEIHLDPTTTAEVVTSALRLLRRGWEWRDKTDRVQVEMTADLLPVVCDRQAISVALQLLLDNALKFSAERVRLRVAPSGGGIEFRVSDSGIGIPPALRERIFEPFFQADSANARKFGGSGVGLAIVRLILERHGVRIHIESTPGVGSSFSFVLPTVPGTALPI